MKLKQAICPACKKRIFRHDFLRVIIKAPTRNPAGRNEIYHLGCFQQKEVK